MTTTAQVKRSNRNPSKEASMLHYSDLSPAQKGFVDRVSDDLYKARKGEVAIYGDGSASPAGEKFAAKHMGASWEVCFDFGTGRCFHTAIQLPLNI